jgi:hypothetical protein
MEMSLHGQPACAQTQVATKNKTFFFPPSSPFALSSYLLPSLLQENNDSPASSDM